MTLAAALHAHELLLEEVADQLARALVMQRPADGHVVRAAARGDPVERGRRALEQRALEAVQAAQAVLDAPLLPSRGCSSDFVFAVFRARRETLMLNSARVCGGSSTTTLTLPQPRSTGAPWRAGQRLESTAARGFQ